MIHPFHRHSSRERGYVLLALLLFVALLSIGVLVTIQNIEFQIRRDREEEMIHRGVQYSRAVRRFINTFRRYPQSIEELEGTNNIRFLRKRYKDPITGQEFRLLHMDEVSSFNRPAGVAVAAPEAPPESDGQSDNAEAVPETVSEKADTQDNPEQAHSGDKADASQVDPRGASAPEGSGAKTVESKNLEAPPLRGLPVVGVASISKGRTIREFNHQAHYNQWQFIYDPSTDRGGLIRGPSQPLPSWVQQAPSAPDAPGGQSGSPKALSRATQPPASGNR